MATSTKTHVSRSSVLFFRLNFVPFVHPFWNSELVWQPSNSRWSQNPSGDSMSHEKWFSIGWLWHPEKGSHQILASKLRLIVTIYSYLLYPTDSFNQQQLQKVSPKKDWTRSTWTQSQLGRTCSFSFRNEFRFQPYIFRLVPFYQSTGYPRKCIWPLLRQSWILQNQNLPSCVVSNPNFATLWNLRSTSISLNKLTLRIRSTPPWSNRNFRVPIPSEKNRNGSE